MTLESGLKLLVDLSKNGDGYLGIRLDVNDRYYVDIPFLVQGKASLSCNAGEHCVTIKAAVNSCIEALKNKTLVFNNDSDERRNKVFFYYEEPGE